MNRRQPIDFHPKRLEDLPLWAPAPSERPVITVDLNESAETAASREADLREWFGEPQRRKAVGQAKVLTRSAANRAWWDTALENVRDFLLKLQDGAFVNADMWRDAIRVDPPHPNAYGALAGQLARNGWIEWTGTFTTSTQPQGNDNPIKVWRVNRAAVVAGEPKKEKREA